MGHVTFHKFSPASALSDSHSEATFGHPTPATRRGLRRTLKLSASNMIRASISSGSRAVASSSQTSAFLHTSSVLSSQASKQKVLRARKINIANTVQRLKDAEIDKRSVVLGTRPSEEATVWKNCKLAKVLVDEDVLFTPGVPDVQEVEVKLGFVQLPKEIGYGVDEAEKKLLFDDLPAATVDMITHNVQVQEASKVLGELPVRSPTAPSALLEANLRELNKANLFARALDLRNANAGGISFENRRRIIAAFSTPQNPFDTGRTEVQVALLTYKIRNLWSHLKRAKRDVGNRRGLAKLVHQRAKLLRYLKGKSIDRYETVLEELALTPDAVEGELVV